MPLFKKFLVVIIINLIILLAAYIAIYAYSLNNGEDFALIKDYNKIIEYGFKDVKNSLLIQFIDMFSDSIVYIFSFKYANISNNVKCYFVIIAITSIPFILLLFRFLTYRGFQAFKLRIKKDRANPFYYRDYVEANKDYGVDNIEEVDNSILIFLFPVRLLALVGILLVMPVILIIDLVIQLVGLFRGITNTGKALDFE
ncbi:MAG: hypothetical protein K6E87_04405 [bacterium]|nr:hypothetical protein [bacterium]